MTITARSTSETQIAAAVVAHLQNLKWDVHQEVELSTGGRRADIVAVQGPLLWIIEAKAVCGLAVLSQAIEWVLYGAAHLVTVATLKTNRYGGGETARDTLLRDYGIGWLTVHHIDEQERRWNSESAWPVRVQQPPRMVRAARRSMAATWLRQRLCEETRTYAKAGNANGARWTPFQATCKELRRVLHTMNATDGVPVRAAIAAMSHHHYANDASARGTLLRWIQHGEVEGVEVVDAGQRPMRIRLKAGASV